MFCEVMRVEITGSSQTLFCILTRGSSAAETRWTRLFSADRGSCAGTLFPSKKRPISDLVVTPPRRASLNSSPGALRPFYFPLKQELSQCFGPQLTNCCFPDYGPSLASFLLAVAKRRGTANEVTLCKTCYASFP